MARWRSIVMSVLLLAGCSAAPSVSSSDVSRDRPGWQTMRHIKLAAFSARDAQEYDLMIFCDADHHVRLYHLVPPDEMSAELALRTGQTRVVIQGQRELVRATPPPTSSEEGELLGIRISGRLDRASAAWRTFEQTGALEVESGAHITDASATPLERAALASLFSECSQ